MATATKTKRTTKRRRPKAAASSAVPETQAEAAAKEAAAGGDVEILERGVDLPVAKIDPHPHNPRADWGDISGLAKSLKKTQLQDLVLREGTRGRYQLIAGNRRLRAAKKAKLKTLRATVIACDDATALELLGRENVERQDFNAIEEAKWLQALLEETGMSQRQLSAHLQQTMQRHDGAEMSQGHIANRLRLLKLPAWWQQQLISGAITAAHLRELATWAERTQVLDALKIHAKAPKSVEEWRQTIRRVIEDVTLPATPGQWTWLKRGRKSWHGVVPLTKKDCETHAEELDIVDVPGRWHGTEKRAFGVEKWWELYDQRIAAQKTRKAKSQAAENGRVAKSSETAARKAQRQAAILTRRLFAWKVRHFQQQLAERLAIAEGDTLNRLLVWWMALDNRGELLQKLVTGRADRHVNRFQLLKGLADLKSDRLAEIAREAMAIWITEECVDRCVQLRPAAVLLMAEQLGLDLAATFRADADFLGLYTADQLRALAKEWKLTKSIDGVSKRADLIGTLAGIAGNRRLPPPKALLKAKG